jgi:hypothetical protein
LNSQYQERKQERVGRRERKKREGRKEGKKGRRGKKNGDRAEEIKLKNHSTGILY